MGTGKCLGAGLAARGWIGRDTGGKTALADYFGGDGKAVRVLQRLPAVMSGVWKRIRKKRGKIEMATEMLMTQEGYDALKKELDQLKSVTRGEISEKIRVARGFGDLSENSEYDEAKNEQAVVEARIKKLEDQLKCVKIISRDQLSSDTVNIGSHVKILDMEFDEEMEYTIASSVESHSDLNAISDESPVGKALIGHRVGDVVEVSAPAAMLKLKILEISL